MRINLKRKDLVNLSLYANRFSKLISENLIEDFFSLITFNLKKKKKLRYQNLVLFLLDQKIKNWKKSKN